jgi:hypothetical protein
MPFRLDEFRAKIQFITSAEMPNLIFKACQATGTVSNTRYIQEAVCERLARDLDIPVADLLDRLPPPKGMSATLLERPKRRSAEVG